MTLLLFQYTLAGREMNIQVATSELPITSPRSGPRLSGASYTQRPQTRFRGNRGAGSIRGKYNLQYLIKCIFQFKI